MDKFRANAKRAAMVQSRIKALARMDAVGAVQADEADPNWRFRFPDPPEITAGGAPPLQLVEVSFGYDRTRPLFKGATLGIGLDSRIALVGPNGAGKSTLLRLMQDELTPLAGHVARHSKLKVARIDQHHADSLEMDLTPLEFMAKKYPGVKPEEIRAHLGGFGIKTDMATRAIGTLSGGQKSRVAFAMVAWERPHVLLADEITNHMDIASVDALVVALAEF